MGGRQTDRGYRVAGGVLVRAAALTRRQAALPAWPDESRDGAPGWAEWLGEAWSRPQLADAVGHASPQLARAVAEVCASGGGQRGAARRAAVSVAWYAARMTGRATPAGLLAGVAPVAFASRASVRWGADHTAVAGAEAGWLAGLAAALEGDRTVLCGLSVQANDTLVCRAGRVIVPYQARRGEQGLGAVDVSLRATPALRVALDAARTPVRAGHLADVLRERFGHADRDKALRLIERLVAARVLITALHAPGTETDALGHLVDALERVEEQPAVLEPLREIRVLLAGHRTAGAERAREIRERAATAMSALAPAARHPVALDLRLDAQVAVPYGVVREVERAADLLGRLCRLPCGTDGWNRYFARFYERFGPGALVPLRQMVSESGIGWPQDYLADGGAPARTALTGRDATLLALAQQAALDGGREVVLDEGVLAALEHRQYRAARLPGHLELCVRVDAADTDALAAGRFLVTVLSVSRGQGVLTGRFRHVLDPGRTGPGLAVSAPDGETVYAQLSSPRWTRPPRTWPASADARTRREPRRAPRPGRGRGPRAR